jgi:hypothetical protein
MKRFIPLLLFYFLLPACRNEQSRYVLSTLDDFTSESDTTFYPLFIEGGTKVVYQRGYMTPDKGLKLHVDTMPVPAGGLKLDHSLWDQLRGEHK